MHKGRLEAFSDGVIAILITIMVLEFRPPHSADLESLRPLISHLISYVISFVYLAIYWNNHHHMMQATQKVNGQILWANSHLLFWLSLIPFATAWLGENHFAALPMAFYGVILLCCGIAYFILSRLLIRYHGKDSKLAIAIGSDFKGKLSVVLYATAIPVSFLQPWVSFSIYGLVSIIWLYPDRRIEKLYLDG